MNRKKERRSLLYWEGITFIHMRKRSITTWWAHIVDKSRQKGGIKFEEVFMSEHCIGFLPCIYSFSHLG